MESEQGQVLALTNANNIQMEEESPQSRLGRKSQKGRREAGEVERGVTEAMRRRVFKKVSAAAERTSRVWVAVGFLMCPITAGFIERRS